MKKTKSSNETAIANEADEKNSKSNCHGLTERLLDKYKTSKKFIVIDETKRKNNDPKAA